jgi:hypothetical protein
MLQLGFEMTPTCPHGQRECRYDCVMLVKTSLPKRLPHGFERQLRVSTARADLSFSLPSTNRGRFPARRVSQEIYDAATMAIYQARSPATAIRPTLC